MRYLTGILLCLIWFGASPVRADACKDLVDDVTRLSSRAGYKLDDFTASVERAKHMHDVGRMCAAFSDAIRDGETARRMAYDMYNKCGEIRFVCSKDNYPGKLERRCLSMQRRSGEQFAMVDKMIRLRSSTCR